MAPDPSRRSLPVTIQIPESPSLLLYRATTFMSFLILRLQLPVSIPEQTVRARRMQRRKLPPAGEKKRPSPGGMAASVAFEARFGHTFATT